MAEGLAWSGVLAILGAVVGSFVAVLVIRWPQGRSVVHGRSSCDGCAAPLSPVELVPLASALLLRGRCRRCGTAIDPRHWQIELTAALIGAAAGIASPGPAALAGAAFGWLLLALAALDLALFWLPDRLTATVATAGLASGVLGVPPLLADRLIGGVVGYGALALVAASYRGIRGRDGMGRGDPKLLGAIGLWLGWRMLPAVVLLAALTGLAAVLVLRVRGQVVDRDTRLPFGALLAVAAYPSWLVLLGWPA